MVQKNNNKGETSFIGELLKKREYIKVLKGYKGGIFSTKAVKEQLNKLNSYYDEQLDDSTSWTIAYKIINHSKNVSLLDAVSYIKKHPHTIKEINNPPPQMVRAAMETYPEYVVLLEEDKEEELRAAWEYEDVQNFGKYRHYSEEFVAKYIAKHTYDVEFSNEIIKKYPLIIEDLPKEKIFPEHYQKYFNETTYHCNKTIINALKTPIGYELTKDILFRYPEYFLLAEYISTEDLCKLVDDSDSYSLLLEQMSKYCENEKVLLKIVEKNEKYIENIQNPSEELINKAIDYKYTSFELIRKFLNPRMTNGLIDKLLEKYPHKFNIILDRTNPNNDIKKVESSDKIEDIDNPTEQQLISTLVKYPSMLYMKSQLNGEIDNHYERKHYRGYGDAKLIKFIHDTDFTEKIITKAIKQNLDVLEGVQIQTEQMVLAALDNGKRDIKNIKYFSSEICNRLLDLEIDMYLKMLKLENQTIETVLKMLIYLENQDKSKEQILYLHNRPSTFINHININ